MPLIAAATVTTTPTIVIPANGMRRSLWVKNPSTNAVTIFLKFDGGATALTVANGWPLAPGDWITIGYQSIPADIGWPVLAVVASGTADLRVHELSPP